MDDDDDGTSLSGQVASDYKTAFSTGPDECDTIQMKGQALVLAAHFPNEDFYIREVVNMRTGASYRQSTFNDAAGKAEMASWRTRIQSAIRYAEVRDASGNRIAKPGESCMGCPFVTSCKPAQSYMKDVGLGDDATHERIVAAYAVSQARADALKSIVQRIVDNGAVNVDGGRVGYIAMKQRMGKEGAHITLLQHWLKMDDGQFMAWRAGNGDIVKLRDNIGVFHQQRNDGRRQALDVGRSQKRGMTAAQAGRVQSILGGGTEPRQTRRKAEEGFRGQR
jgi:hypothetical protein